jgi:outer membrane protein assembly factor BamB
MKRILIAAAALFATCTSTPSTGPSAPALPGSAGPDVLQHHRSAGRDGLYVLPTLTRAAAARVRADFTASLPGSSFYAQPLYVAGVNGGPSLLVVASEQDVVSALDAATGKVVWQRQLGTPVPLSQLPCGNIDPLGVTGTPVIDSVARTIYVAAMTTPDGGATKRHQVFALSLDDGSVRGGWPVDVGATARSGATAFDAAVQNQRGALALVSGVLYVPYGGHFGDCGKYHGWLIGFPVSNPGRPTAWATPAIGGGAWAPSGVASDGTSLFIATGNTFGADTWSGGEAVLRFSPGPVLADWFAPPNWKALDAGDVDIGGTGPVLVDVPGATPSALVVALGKDGKMYLLDRAHLGNIGGQVAVAAVASDEIINAAAAYTTSKGAYVVFKGTGASCPAGRGGDLTAVRISAASPPTLVTAWCASQNGLGSPMVTTTDGHGQAVVWSLGAEGDGRLHAFDGDTGAEIASVAVGAVRRYQTPIAAGGRLYVLTDGAVRALIW